LPRRTADADDEKPLLCFGIAPDCGYRWGHAMRRFVILAALLLIGVGCSSTETAQKPSWLDRQFEDAASTASFMTESPTTFMNRKDDAFSKDK
jgi:hypothetical protein